MKSPFTAEELKRQLEGILEFDYRTSIKEASLTQIYRALSSIVVNHLKEKRHEFMRQSNSEGKKQVYYLSMEFLMGRSLKTSLYNLGMQDEAEKALNDIGVKIDKVYEEEPGGKDYFWEFVPLVLRKDKYAVEIRQCEKSDIMEIDNYYELAQLDPAYR